MSAALTLQARGRRPPAETRTGGKHECRISGPFRALERHWKDPQGNWLRTFTIVTGEPNELVAPIHNRMPVILRPQDYGIWLGEKPADAEVLLCVCANSGRGDARVPDQHAGQQPEE